MNLAVILACVSVFIIFFNIALLFLLDKRPKNFVMNAGDVEILPNYIALFCIPFLAYLVAIFITSFFLKDDFLHREFMRVEDHYFSIAVTLAVVLYSALFRLKRFYLTNEGLVIFNLFTKSKKSLPRENIFYGESLYTTKLYASSFYIRFRNKNIYFNRFQVPNEVKFINYFLTKGIPYYKWNEDGDRIEQ